MLKVRGRLDRRSWVMYNTFCKAEASPSHPATQVSCGYHTKKFEQKCSGLFVCVYREWVVMPALFFISIRTETIGGNDD